MVYKCRKKTKLLLAENLNRFAHTSCAFIRIFLLLQKVMTAMFCIVNDKKIYIWYKNLHHKFFYA